MERVDREKIEKSKEVIVEAFRRFSNPAVVVSVGKDSMVMLDLVLRYGDREPIVYGFYDPIPIDEELTLSFAKEVIEHYGLRRVVWYHEVAKPYLEKVREPGLNKVECCNTLKVKPLNDFIEKYKVDALFVGIRRDEHPERAKESYFSKRKNHWRVHPILHFTWLDVWLYIKEFKVPINPLYLKGYVSIGCKPCTKIVRPEGFRSIDEIIEFVKSGRVRERESRDREKELSMNRLRALGYF